MGIMSKLPLKEIAIQGGSAIAGYLGVSYLSEMAGEKISLEQKEIIAATIAAGVTLGSVYFHNSFPSNAIASGVIIGSGPVHW